MDWMNRQNNELDRTINLERGGFMVWRRTGPHLATKLSPMKGETKFGEEDQLWQPNPVWQK